MRKISQIILHCSDSTFGDVEQVRAWHLERGFADIGYHYVVLNGRIRPADPIDEDLIGHVQKGRPVVLVGAHVRGHNRYSIGVCMIGRDAFDSRQICATLHLIRDLMAQYAIPVDRVRGHHELDHGKRCPCIDMKVFRSALSGLEALHV